MIHTHAYKPAKSSRGTRLFGFTIVELLIVIAVISILAAITIISYGAVRQRAENAKTLAAIDQYAKALQVYKASTGDYPLTGAGFLYGCVAESGLCAMVGGTGGADCANLGASGISAPLNAAIKTVIPTIPAVSDQTMQCEGKIVRGALYVVYGNYFGPDDRNGYLLYFLKGDQPCVSPAGSKLVTPNGRIYYSTDTTRCFLQFDA